jgi:type I restriction enzyme S subunit
MHYGLADDVIDKICTVFRQYKQIDKAVLYGSRAKGNYKHGSDIDLTLFGDKLNYKLLMDVFDDLDELLLPYSIDLSVYEDISNDKLKEHINRVGVVFYERIIRQGWEVKKLEDVCSLFADGDWVESKDQSLSGIRLIQTGNVGIGVFRDKIDKARYISEEKFKQLKCTEIFEGDCLISRLPDPVGRACIVPNMNERMITVVDCSIIRFQQNKILNKWFLFYSLSNMYQQQINSQISGATRQRISRKNLGQIGVPIPPLAEQQQIVAVLDKTFSAIAKAKINAGQNLKNAKEIFESYLQNIFENRGNDWGEKTLGEITSILGDGLHGTPRYTENGECYFINGNNLINDNIVFKENTKQVSALEYKKHKKNLNDRTILVSINGTLGNVAFYNNQKIILGKSVCYFNLLDNFDKYFIRYILISPCFLNYAFSEATGATIKNVSLKTMRGFKVSFPPLHEQQKIVQQLDTLSAETKRLETMYQQKINNLEELKKSILNKAFNGELV